MMSGERTAHVVLAARRYMENALRGLFFFSPGRFRESELAIEFGVALSPPSLLVSSCRVWCSYARVCGACVFPPPFFFIQ